MALEAVQNIIIFIGPPGAGKGSLALYCKKELGLVQLSTGNLCRKHILEKTKIGQEIDFAIKSGSLVPDILITNMVVDWFDHVIQDSWGIILDGYPRTVVQAKMFDDLLKIRPRPTKVFVVRLVIADDEVVGRLGSRYMCLNKDCQAVYSLSKDSGLSPRNPGECDQCGSILGRRDDDNESAIKERLKTYYRHESDLIRFYQMVEQDIKEVNVSDPIDRVFENLKRALGFS